MAWGGWNLSPNWRAPLYRLRSPAMAEEPDTIMIVGFWGERMLRVQAQGTNQQVVLRDAVSLVTNALATLRNQARNP